MEARWERVVGDVDVHYRRRGRSQGQQSHSIPLDTTAVLLYHLVFRDRQTGIQTTWERGGVEDISLSTTRGGGVLCSLECTYFEVLTYYMGRILERLVPFIHTYCACLGISTLRYPIIPPNIIHSIIVDRAAHQQ